MMTRDKRRLEVGSCSCRFLPQYWSLVCRSLSLDEWSGSTGPTTWRLIWGAVLKAHLPSSSLPPSLPSHFLMPPCTMIINIQSTERALAHHSSTVMWVLVVFAGTYPLSFMRVPQADFVSPVLLLFGVGTSVRLAYRRWSEGESSTEDTRIPSPHPPVRARTKVSFPASGVNRAHANASQGPSPPHVSLSS